ncbi:MAG: YcgL domain-containing protein [Alcanivoracaceae bacterium]|nr:YcgL domain-containing protein [Alcanivoracaceae bacterium]
MIDDHRLLCSVFRSPKREGMYLYVRRDQDLRELPEALMKVFGIPAHSMDLLLSAEKKLARVEAAKVIAQIREQGFFLQMPPQDNEEPLPLARKNRDA